MTTTIGAVLLTACRPYVPPKVTVDGILAVERGMTYAQVEALIGPPLCITGAGEGVGEAGFSEEEVETIRELVECLPPWRPQSLPTALRRQSFGVSYAEPRTGVARLKICLHFIDGLSGTVYVKVNDMGICCLARDDDRARGADGQYTGPFYGSGSRELLAGLLGR